MDIIEQSTDENDIDRQILQRFRPQLEAAQGGWAAVTQSHSHSLGAQTGKSKRVTELVRDIAVSSCVLDIREQAVATLKRCQK